MRFRLHSWPVIWALVSAAVPGAAADSLSGALDAAAAATATSRTHEFVVHGRPPPAARYGRMRNSEEFNPVVELQPQSLAISAERIQTALLSRLGATAAGTRGRFHLFIIPTNRFGSGPLEIIPRPFRESWQYHVGVPESVDWRRLVRGLSEALLLELANRGSVDVLARTPLWLNEGMAGILEIEEGRSLIQEPEAAVVRTGRRGDPLATSRSALQGSGLLTYSELSQPTVDIWANTNQFSRFQASAILFTKQLLLEDGGSARVRQAIMLSPQFLNWEFALLRAYDGRFLSALDIEKWWAVNAAAVLSRDPLQRWTREQTVARLRDVTWEATRGQTDSTTPETRRKMRLDELITGVPFPAQREVVERKLGQLREVYRQSPDALLSLIQDYYRCLENYLNQRQNAGVDPTGRGALEVRTQLLARQTSHRLNELNRRLDSLR